MQPLHNTFNTIKEQLRNLSPTAKMLIGSLMVIVLLTLFLVAQYTARSAMEPLGLSTTLTPDARNRTISYLQTRNIPHRERAGEIFVPVDQKYAVLAQLTDGEIITPDQINFDSLVQQDSPFLSKAQNERRWLVATMNVLSRTISHMDGIDRATVFIDEPKNPSGIGRAHIPASASVTVHTRGSGLSQDQVDAIAEMVAGAHARLNVLNVSIIDNTAGKRYRARSRESMASTSNLDLQLRKEEVLREKLNDSLGYIPGVNVAVQVTVDTREIIRRTRDFEDPKLGVTSESRREIVSSQMADGGEAGVRPNTGASISGGGSGSEMRDERSESSLLPVFGGSDSRITDPRGLPLQINASIGVPRSYFVGLWQQQNNAEATENAQPEQAELDVIIEQETNRIRAQIMPLIDTRAVDGAVSGDVHVSMFPDFAMAATTGGGYSQPAIQEAAGTVSQIVSDGVVKYVTLAGLALLSLVMMFLMVRKANVKEELPTADELVGSPPSLTDSDSDVVGEAGETPLSLEGLELDDDDIRRQQMLEQIKDMAQNQPSEAATLLRRWIKAEV